MRGDAILAFIKACTNGAVVLLFPLSATVVFSTALALLAAFAPAISTFALLTLALPAALPPPVAFAVLLPLPWCAVVASIGKSFLVAAEILLLVVAVAAESASKVYLHFISGPLACRSVRPLTPGSAEGASTILSAVSSSLVPLELRWVVLMRGKVTRTFSNTMSKISPSVSGSWSFFSPLQAPPQASLL